MQAVLNELSELADLVLIDAPPVLAVTDAGLLARIVDAEALLGLPVLGRIPVIQSRANGG